MLPALQKPAGGGKHFFFKILDRNLVGERVDVSITSEKRPKRVTAVAVTYLNCVAKPLRFRLRGQCEMKRQLPVNYWRRRSEAWESAPALDISAAAHRNLIAAAVLV